MVLTLTRPMADVELITNMPTMQKAVDAANNYLNLKARKPVSGITDFEEAEQAQELADAYERMKKTKQECDDSTVVLHLSGLPSSQWRQITLKTVIAQDDGTYLTDLPEQAILALPDMLKSANFKNGTDEPVADVLAILPELSDSQLADIMTAVQNLNNPSTVLPKEIGQIISDSATTL